MNQQEVEAWIAANGGPGAVQYTSGKKRLPNPAYGRTLPSGEDNPQYEPGAQQFVESDEEAWVNSKTGATLRVKRKTDGSFDVLENRQADPNKPGSTGDAAPPGGKPFIDDGAEAGTAGRRWGWNPTTKAYDRDLGPSPSAQKPPEVKPPTTVSTNTTEPFIVTRMPDGSLKSEPNPNYKGPEQKPGSTLQIKGADGRTYLVPVDAQGKPGKPQMLDIPGEGPSTPTTAGPQLPQIVLGAATDAARTYKQQLQEGVASGRWSQAWADARWKEFFDVAGLAVQEAATRQNEIESTRNATFNVAQQKQNAMSTATSNALTFVNSINGSLPAGSNLGGQAFAALLGINMIQSLASGIQTFNPNVKPPQITPADLSNPTALAAKRDEVVQAATAAAAPPVRDDWRTQPSQPAPARPAAAPVAPVAPAPPVQPPRPGASPTPPPATMGDIPYNGSNPTPGVDAIPPGVTPVPGTGQVPGEKVGGEVLPQPAEEQAAPELPEAEAPDPGEEIVTVTNRFGRTGKFRRSQWERIKNTLYVRLGGWTEGEATPTPVQPRPEYQPTVPLNRPGVAPQAPAAPAWNPETDPMPESPGAMSKVMPAGMGEWAALAPMIPQQQQPMPQQAQASPGMPVAAMRARIASTPPWRLSTEDIEQAMAMGIPEQEIWAVPGRVA